MTAAPQPVLLYDGECGLCGAIVRRLLRTDRATRLKFASLQSAPAQAYLAARGLPTCDFDTLVFVPDWNAPVAVPPLFRTDGMLAAATIVGGWWRSVAWLRVLPASWRDVLYRFVARARHRFFAMSRPSLPPDPAWAERFLTR